MRTLSSSGCRLRFRCIGDGDLEVIVQNLERGELTHEVGIDRAVVAEQAEHAADIPQLRERVACVADRLQLAP